MDTTTMFGGQELVDLPLRCSSKYAVQTIRWWRAALLKVLTSKHSTEKMVELAREKLLSCEQALAALRAFEVDKKSLGAPAGTVVELDAVVMLVRTYPQAVNCAKYYEQTLSSEICALGRRESTVPQTLIDELAAVQRHRVLAAEQASTDHLSTEPK